MSIGFAYEKVADTRRPPQRTPSLVSDALVFEFDFESSNARGELNLDRPTQTLHYDFRLAGIADSEILAINLHRGGAGGNGPVIDLLGRNRSGSVAIRNEDLDDLLANGLYIAVYTREAPTGAARGQIVRGIR